MVETKSLEQTRAAWEESHGRVAKRYKDGVSAVSDWQGKALEGEDLYGAAVTEAVAERRRAKGIERVSTDEWKKKTLDKGGQRIAQGMAAGKQKYASRMGEVLSVIQGVDLPPRTTDPAQNVVNRVTPIAVALNNYKKGR